MQLAEHYEQLWQSAIHKFELGRFETDALLNNPVDNRYGITLLARPPQQVKKRIQAFLSEIRKVEPAQYYYPDSDLHITVMSIISCHPGFSLDKIEVQAYGCLIRQALQQTGSFQVTFRGITASPSCVMLQGFPHGDTLQKIRDSLRLHFRQSDLQQSLDQRYAIQTAHSTVVRFRRPVAQKKELLKILQAYREHDFGTFTIDRLELVFNDWYQRHAVVRTLEIFPL